jgi:hypothetical protein
MEDQTPNVPATLASFAALLRAADRAIIGTQAIIANHRGIMVEVDALAMERAKMPCRNTSGLVEIPLFAAKPPLNGLPQTAETGNRRGVGGIPRYGCGTTN